MFVTIFIRRLREHRACFITYIEEIYYISIIIQCLPPAVFDTHSKMSYHVKKRHNMAMKEGQIFSYFDYEIRS